MKRNTFYFFMFMLVLLALNVSKFFSNDDSYAAEPYDLSVETYYRYMGYPVYFVGQDRLVEVREKTDVLWRDKYKNIVGVYLKQADHEIQGRSKQILDVPINKLIVSGNKIFIYTELEAFKNEKYNRSNFYYYVMSLVNSLTEEGRGKTVYFIFDETAKAPVLYGLDMNQGFMYDEDLVTESRYYPQIFVRQFFLDIYSGDYRAAFRKLPKEARNQASLRDFDKAFETYAFYRNNEFPWDFIFEKTRDGYDIKVVFPPGSIHEDEDWGLSIVNGKLSIGNYQELIEYLP